MRNSNKELEEEGDKRLAIPITVRQLEAVVRISESLAKMELKPFATDSHVDEAIRIFQVRIFIEFLHYRRCLHLNLFRYPLCLQLSPGTCPELKVLQQRRIKTFSTKLRSS